MIPLCTVVESLNPHGMVPTSPPDILKKIENLQMLLMEIWIRLHVVTTTLVGHDKRGQMESLITAGRGMILPFTVVEALNPHGEWSPHPLKA
jgi:hypothetical protein